MDQILEWVDIKNKLSVTKIGGATVGFYPNEVLQNLNFLTF